jgi:hypothetical protein
MMTWCSGGGGGGRGVVSTGSGLLAILSEFTCLKKLSFFLLFTFVVAVAHTVRYVSCWRPFLRLERQQRTLFSLSLRQVDRESLTEALEKGMKGGGGQRRR